jgi:drug/metabolite transporter (DMT)-like permease
MAAIQVASLLARKGAHCEDGAAAAARRAAASLLPGVRVVSLDLRGEAAPGLLSGLAPARGVSGALAGIGLTVLGVLLFAGCNALTKWLVADMPVGEILFLRSVVTLLLLAPFIGRHDLLALRAEGRWGLHAVRIGFSAIEVGCFYWALSGLPLGDTTTIYLAAPIYVTALSAVFLRERVGWRRWVAVLAGFVGVLVALRPSEAALSPHALVAVGGSLLYAGSLVATRRLRGTSNVFLVATQVAAVLLLSAATAPFGWVLPSLGEAALVVLVGVVSTGGYLCVNGGLQLAPASAVAPFQYTSIVWAMVLGHLVFAETYAATTLLGAAIIVAAGVFIVVRESRLEKAATKRRRNGRQGDSNSAADRE